MNLKVFLSLLEHFLSKSGGDCTFIHQFIECQSEYRAFITFTKKSIKASVIYDVLVGIVIFLQGCDQKNRFKEDYICLQITDHFK